jgi:hypothetical protein
MYIPRPAKLLFQADDGWNRFLIKHGHSVPEWTKLVIERMLPMAPVPWGVSSINTNAESKRAKTETGLNLLTIKPELRTGWNLQKCPEKKATAPSLLA